MSSRLGILLCVAGLVLLGRGAAGQWNVARFDTSRNRIYATAGLDPAIVTAVGVGRTVPLLGREVQVVAEFGVVASELDIKDYRARLGVQTAVIGWRSLRLTGSATFIARGTENTIYSAVGFGSDFTGTLGLYRRGWFAAGEFGFDKEIITHVTNSDWYRRWFYQDARDGWYIPTGGNFHSGLVTGVAIRGVEFAARAGLRWSEGGDAVLPPFYGSVGIGVGF
jgi:hypothetical protein